MVDIQGNHSDSLPHCAVRYALALYSAAEFIHVASRVLDAPGPLSNPLILLPGPVLLLPLAAECGSVAQ